MGDHQTFSSSGALVGHACPQVRPSNAGFKRVLKSSSVFGITPDWLQPCSVSSDDNYLNNFGDFNDDEVNEANIWCSGLCHEMCTRHTLFCLSNPSSAKIYFTKQDQSSKFAQDLLNGIHAVQHYLVSTWWG